jgi:hypothetical protein
LRSAICDAAYKPDQTCFQARSKSELYASYASWTKVCSGHIDDELCCVQFSFHSASGCEITAMEARNIQNRRSHSRRSIHWGTHMFKLPCKIQRHSYRIRIYMINSLSLSERLQCGMLDLKHLTQHSMGQLPLLHTFDRLYVNDQISVVSACELTE